MPGLAFSLPDLTSWVWSQDVAESGAGMPDLRRLKEKLGDMMSRLPGGSPYYTRADGLILLEARTERHPTSLVHNPALCVVVQGAKWTTFGNQRLDYRSGQAMVVGIEMPGFSQVVEGTDGAPYYSVIIELDLAVLRQVYETMSTPPNAMDAPALGAFVMDLDEALVCCVTRMIGTLDEADAVSILYPGLMRELCYRLLRGPYASAFARMIFGIGKAGSLVAVIRQMRENYASPLRLGRLADVAGLSPSAFHRKFRAMTSMTPLEYQKQLRLMEARRLMIADHVSAETAAFKVGYASPSHFSRDYTRRFGGPPRRDIEALRVDHPR
jgi:AraC-like DNA-binding protein